ncbi:MAG: hypothetical protein RMJ56_16500 [Gemmataceae bacterium]|nr:hypothetical protein [Gemmata sp.]MDW8199198.1 hypothetical protein [Gemmataceae bacterium]
MITRFAIIASVALGGTAPLRADDGVDAQTQLKNYLRGISGSEAGRSHPLTGEGIPETFPDYALFSHIFPLYPVARPAPEPLKSTNIIAIPKAKGQKPILITDTKELEKFFQQHARSVKKATEADEATTAWLRAVAELHQDGYFQFTIQSQGTKVEGVKMISTGEARVDPRNMDKGQITAQLTFQEGRLMTVETKVNISAGIRPRCQATKLLDPDPIVRAMAEDALRVMGSSAKPYLDEQYQKASPELKKAIDRIREQIDQEGR